MLSAFMLSRQSFWSGACVISSENTSKEKSRVNSKLQTSLVSNCSKRLYKMIETVKNGVTWKSGDMAIKNLTV